MATQIFLDHFERLTDAPNAVARLRELVLQLAVQGRLVAQDKRDEPAARLLERIEAERKGLVRGKKIKEAKPLPPVSVDEKPFEIPDSWRWARLQEVLLKLTDGTHHSPPNTQTGDYKYITAKNIKQGRLDLSNITYVTEQIHQEIFSRCDPQLGDILYIKDGATTGIVAINDLDEPFSMLSSVALLKCPAQLYNRYLFYLLSSPYFYSLMRGGMTGVAITRVTIAKLSYAAIPLPPLEEQKRIVAKVDELMRLCDELERAQGERREARRRLNRAALDQLLAARDAAEFQARWQIVSDHFPILTSALDQIGMLRQAVLQLAVQGKLTREDPQDEPASVMLEKAKLVASVKAIPQEQIPYKLPKSWLWVRFGDVFDIQGGTQPPKSNFVHSPREGYVRLLQIRDFGSKPEPIYVPANSVRGFCTVNDVMLARYGASVGKVFMGQEGAYNVALTKIIFRHEHIYNHYVFLLLKSALFQERLQTASRSAQAGFNKGDIHPILLPLPPFEEQKRLVAAVNRLMALCDELEAGLRLAEEDGERLLRAAVRSLLAPALKDEDEQSAELVAQVQ